MLNFMLVQLSSLILSLISWRALYREEAQFYVNDKGSGGRRPGRDCCLYDKGRATAAAAAPPSLGGVS